MRTPASSAKLERFYRFFETYGTERLNGLDESYFADLSEIEKEEAWNFLRELGLSEESITGLCILNKPKAIALIKDVLELPIGVSQYPAEQKAIESARLFMLRYLNSVEPNEKYVTAMCVFAQSAFEDIRVLFTQSLPAQKITPSALEALKGIIFTETEVAPLSAAITKLMLIYGLDFDRNDPLYKSLYRSLRSDDPKEKMAAMNRLEKIQQPDFI